jgi:hypothetical protein
LSIFFGWFLKNFSKLDCYRFESGLGYYILPKKGGCMSQVHKRFTAEQVKVLLMGYCQGILDRPAIEETLGISKSTFFVLLREYRHNPDEFSLAHHRETPTRLSA